jgi:hypothetical protein
MNYDTIQSNLMTQLSQVTAQRYQPYRPYIYPVIPSSVTKLQMQSANVGIPIPSLSITNCKGVQFVTK